MTTIERSAPRPSPGLRLTSFELRLYAVALLAVVYLLGWRATAPRPAVAEPTLPAPDPAPLPRAPAAAVWMEQLPPAQRPTVALPPGWRVVTRDRAAAAAPPPRPRLVRAPAARRLRVRTRSS